MAVSILDGHDLRVGRPMDRSGAVDPSLAVARPVAINSAFLQEIKDCNRSYWKLLDELRVICQLTDTTSRCCDRLRRVLNEFRDCVAIHFSLEEWYGYISLAEPLDPSLCRLCAITKAEHSTLYLQLTDLAEQAEELQYRGANPAQLSELIERTVRFEKKLMAHESAERTLIAQAKKLK